MSNIGERLNDNTLKQGAWDVLNKNTTGIWPAPSQVGGTDVVNPTTEVCLAPPPSSAGRPADRVMQIVNLATNDAASLSLSEFAVLAIAPELAPNSFGAPAEGLVGPRGDWDQSTLEGSVRENEAGEKEEGRKGRTVMRKRMLCF